MKGWYVVYTHVNGEAKTAANLERQGFSAYLPRYSKIRRHARRREVVAAPLFPRYVFVELDPEADRWRSVHSTFGAIHMVCNGEVPARLPDSFVSEIRTRENEDGYVALNDWSRIAKGDRVRIQDGAFRNQTAVFDCPTDDDRVRVLLEILGRKVLVQVPGETVVLCG